MRRSNWHENRTVSTSGLLLVAALVVAALLGPIELPGAGAATSVPPTDFAWPASGFVSQNVAEHLVSEHQKAVDIANARSNVVVAAAHDGSVVTASVGGNKECNVDNAKSNGYGNYVVLKHVGPGGTLYTLYAHLASVAVKVSQTVKLGSKLGIMGSTGCADGQHVHFAIGTCANVSLSCTIWNAPDPKSGTARTGTRVAAGTPTGGIYQKLGSSNATAEKKTSPSRLPSSGFCSILSAEDIAAAFDTNVSVVAAPVDRGTNSLTSDSCSWDVNLPTPSYGGWLIFDMLQPSGAITFENRIIERAIRFDVDGHPAKFQSGNIFTLVVKMDEHHTYVVEARKGTWPKDSQAIVVDLFRAFLAKVR